MASIAVSSSPRQHHQREKDKGSKDPSRLPTRDIGFIIKTMRALRHPTTIKDSSSSAVAGNTLTGEGNGPSSCSYSSSLSKGLQSTYGVARRGGGGGGLSSPTISSSRKHTTVAAGGSNTTSPHRATIPHKSRTSAAPTHGSPFSSSSPHKSPLSRRGHEEGSVDRRRDVSPLSSSSLQGGVPQTNEIGPLSSPNWRTLLYKDLYQAKEEEKELIRLKYEPLLQAQAKLKQKQDSSQRAAGQGGKTSKGALPSSPRSPKGQGKGNFLSRSTTTGGGTTNTDIDLCLQEGESGSTLSSRAQSPTVAAGGGSKASASRPQAASLGLARGGGGGGGTSGHHSGKLPSTTLGTPSIAPLLLGAIPSGSSTPRPMTMGSARPAPPKAPNTARGAASAGNARRY